MPKYINAKDLELEVSHYLQCEKESETITLEELNEIANRLPSADVVEVKHGKWVGYNFEFYCSNCNRYQSYFVGKSNFCPHCGADMRGETNG